MITFEQAVTRFKKEFPNRKITDAADLDATRFFVVAPDATKEDDYGDPTFFISKKNGKIQQTTCEDEFELIEDAMDNRRIR